ncbi:MAG: copper chaperone PCu(A)C [Candidatus Thioglobus sp.]|nr:MAG: hypothetical protein CBC21_06390 [Proteobacteria bacterium TMED61]RZO17078.1 MAG: copper chaperone PCu(A)C [Candidatus Thioglobus sp.]
MVMCMAGGPVWAGTFGIHAPTVRMVPPGQSVSAAFMILHNHGMKDRSVVAAYSDVADVVELHNHITEDGMMKMRRVDAIVVPGHGEVVLQPGGFHMMLIGLTRSLEMGEKVAIELEFADGKRLSFEAPVQMAPGGHDHANHGD